MGPQRNTAAEERRGTQKNRAQPLKNTDEHRETNWPQNNTDEHRETNWPQNNTDEHGKPATEQTQKNTHRSAL
jgi:hypothetical protein